MKITQPSTSEEFEKYYQVRWETLRAPWNKPKGSEKDELEGESIHAMAVDASGNVAGVVRLNSIGPGQGQVRFMGVKSQFTGKGIGSLLLEYIEQMAREAGMVTIVLHSRETAVPFYLRNNYVLIEKSYLMWGQIQHFLMKKSLL